jgi:putative hydrolase of the HAD superfamily
LTKIQCVLFDLDNTLYPKSCGLMEAIGQRINLYMIERLGVKPEEVSVIRDDFLKAFGTTLNALRRYYPVDPHEFLDFVHDIPLDRHLQYDAALGRMMESLKLRKIIFTNADAKHARRVLARLGILHCFESIIDIHMLDFVNKPYRRAYLKALDFAAARPEECVLVEDMPVNIAPARDLGMTTVLVGKASRPDGAHYHIERINDFEELFLRKISREDAKIAKS